MDIRTKLIFALVAVSLGSMLALGAFLTGAAEEMLRRTALRQLEGLAETKKQDLEKVAVAWHDRAELIASRTQLRLSLRAYAATGDPAERERIERILRDALASVPAVRGLAVLDMKGERVAAVGEATGLPVDGDTGGPPPSPTLFTGLAWADGAAPSVQLAAPLRLEGELVGSLLVRLGAHEVAAVAGETTGLGESGETLITRATLDGGAHFLTRADDRNDATIHRVESHASRDPVLRAAAGEEAVFQDGAQDYRGATVWAATRFLPDLQWGIVVKADEAELLQPVARLRSTIWKLSLSLSAFGIVAGTLLGLYFARPIRHLAEVASRIADGDLEQRAVSHSEDEIGQLALALNRMAEELIETNRSLRERLEERSVPRHGGV